MTSRALECDEGWEMLAAAHGTLPTQDLPWTLASLDAFGETLILFTEGAPMAPSAVAALTRRGYHLRLVGARMFEPSDLLAASPDARAALCHTLVRAGTALRLERIPPGSETVHALRDALGRRGLMRVHPGVGHPVIHLDDRWREPGGGLSPSRRSALRRSRRRAQSLGDVSVQLLAPTPDELEPLLVEAIEVERRSWKGAAGTALAHDGPRNRFVRRYAREMAARGRLRMQFLRIGGAAAAMHIAVEWSDRLWLVKIGYDPDYSSVSPGQILLAHSIADGAQRGLRDYHLLGFTEEWTQAWTSDEEPCVTIDAYPATRRGFVALTDDGLRIAQRRIAPGHPDGRMD